MTRCLMFLLCLTLYAQDVSEEMTVVVRDVRVHVVDRDGRPVTGLTPEDFILKDGKSVRSLTFFEEVDERDQSPTVELSEIDASQIPGADPSSNPSPVSLLLMDSSLLRRDAFEAFVEAAREWVRKSADGRNTLKIVHYDEGTYHITPFSKDKEKLLIALDQVKFKGAFRQQLLTQQRSVVARFEELDIARRTGEDAFIIEDMEQDLARQVSEKERLKANHYKAYHYNMLALSELLSQFPGPKSIFHISGGIYLEGATSRDYINTNEMSKRLAYELNSNGVTVYSLLQADREPLGTVEALGSATSMRSTNTRWNSLTENEYQMEYGPVQLSDLTGGTYLRASDKTNVSKVLNDLRDTSRHYYRLVYTISNDEARRKINVTLADRSLKAKINFGDTFAKDKPYTKMSGQDRAIQFESLIMYSANMRNDLDADFRVDRFWGADGKVLAPVTIDLPLREIPKKGYEIGFAAFGADEFLLDVIKTLINKPPKAPGLRLRHLMVAEAPIARVRFYIRDMDTGALSMWDERMEEPMDAPDAFNLSNLLLFQDDDFKLLPLHYMEQVDRKVKGKTDRSKDPLAMASYLYAGKLPDPVTRKEPLFVFFHINKATGPLDQFAVHAAVVVGDDTRGLALNTVDFHSESDNWRFLGRIDKMDIPPGEHQLIVQVSNNESGERLSKVVPFTYR